MSDNRIVLVLPEGTMNSILVAGTATVFILCCLIYGIVSRFTATFSAASCCRFDDLAPVGVSVPVVASAPIGASTPIATSAPVVSRTEPKIRRKTKPKAYERALQELEEEQGDWYVNLVLSEELANMYSHYRKVDTRRRGVSYEDDTDPEDDTDLEAEDEDDTDEGEEDDSSDGEEDGTEDGEEDDTDDGEEDDTDDGEEDDGEDDSDDGEEDDGEDDSDDDSDDDGEDDGENDGDDGGEDDDGENDRILRATFRDMPKVINIYINKGGHTNITTMTKEEPADPIDLVYPPEGDKN